MAKPSSIHLRLIEVLKKHPEGITAGQWRKELAIAAEEQAHLDRRQRDLKKWFHIEKRRTGAEFRYFYLGARDQPVNAGVISLKTRAEVLNAAHGKCGMCGRTIDRDGIVLVVDHRIPRDWGGSKERENLWAICEDCNAGKKHFFESQDPSLMRRVMGFVSVHMRIGELLKAFKGKPVSSRLIELVSQQDDWKKRTRELRYLGWKIAADRRRGATGRVESSYTLLEDHAWPTDPTRWIQQYERKRAARNQQSR